jgi:opacity protein-like surface antigen
MKELFSSALAASVFIAWMAAPAQAAGFYVSGELGMNFGQSLDTDGHDTDRASVCDEYINPNYATVPATNANCTGPGRGSDSIWENHFGADEGILFGTALGYYIADSRFRVEMEYFYWDTGYDDTSEISLVVGDVLTKVVEEIVRAEERIGDLSSHNLFANVYYDFANDSRFTPYIGFGLGLGFTELEYNGVFARDINPANITTGEGLSNADEIRANLAGTTTTGSENLSDTLFGYQVLLGMDYAITESVLLGVKVRWVEFDSFRDEDEWDQLRSHPSNLRLDGSEAVVYDIEADDIEMFGASLNFKYLF